MENNITPFPSEREYEIGMDITSLNREELTQYLKFVNEVIAELDAAEPKNMMSEKHDDWAEDHEYLEDVRDDIIDALEY